MIQPISFEYLELACYGLSFDQIAKRYGVSTTCVRIVTLRAARYVGRLGFWKFHVLNRDEIDAFSRRILDKMGRHGLLLERKEAA